MAVPAAQMSVESVPVGPLPPGAGATHILLERDRGLGFATSMAPESGRAAPGRNASMTTARVEWCRPSGAH